MLAADEDRVGVGRRRQRGRPAGQHPDPGRVADRDPFPALRFPVAAAVFPGVRRPPLQEADGRRSEGETAPAPSLERGLRREPGGLDDLSRKDPRLLSRRERRPVEPRVEAAAEGGAGHQVRRRGEVPGVDLPAEPPERAGEAFGAGGPPGHELRANLLRTRRRNRRLPPEEADPGLLEDLADRGGEPRSLLRRARAVDRNAGVPGFQGAAGEGPEVGERPKVRRPPDEEDLGAASAARFLPNHDDGDRGARDGGHRFGSVAIAGGKRGPRGSAARRRFASRSAPGTVSAGS